MIVGLIPRQSLLSVLLLGLVGTERWEQREGGLWLRDRQYWLLSASVQNQARRSGERSTLPACHLKVVLVINTGGLVYNQTSSTGFSCSSTIHLDDGEAFCMGCVFTTLQRLKVCCLHVLSAHFARWTKPLRTSLPLATLADLGRSKEELLAENALLRQQLIVLKDR